MYSITKYLKILIIFQILVLTTSYFRQYWKDNRLRFEIKVRSILCDPNHNRPNGYCYCYQGDNQVVDQYTYITCVTCRVLCVD